MEGVLCQCTTRAYGDSWADMWGQESLELDNSLVVRAVFCNLADHLEERADRLSLLCSSD